MIKIFTSRQLEKGLIFQPDSYNMHHLKVCRVLTGEKIYIGDGREREFLGVLEEKNLLRVIKKTDRVIRPSRHVTLFAALLKKKKFEDLIFRCSQIGVSEIVPLITDRTVKVIKNSAKERIRLRWERKARYGAELSMREKIPAVSDPVTFTRALKTYKEGGFDKGLFLYEQEKRDMYITGDDLKRKMALFIGPEGGFTPCEADAARNAGLSSKTLGNLILDSETACLASISLLLCSN